MSDTEFSVEPQLRSLDYGGWLATTSPATKLRIGVIGPTEDEARARFSASLKRWKELNEAEKT